MTWFVNEHPREDPVAIMAQDLLNAETLHDVKQVQATLNEFVAREDAVDYVTPSEAIDLVGKRARHKQPCTAPGVQCVWPDFLTITRVTRECATAVNDTGALVSGMIVDLEFEENKSDESDLVECGHEWSFERVSLGVLDLNHRPVMEEVCANPKCRKVLS